MRETIAHAVVTLPSGERRGVMLGVVGKPLSVDEKAAIAARVKACAPHGSAIEISDGQ